MGQTGFCIILRFPAVFCEALRFPALVCANLHLQNGAFPRKSENLKKSASLAPFVRFSLSLLSAHEARDTKILGWGWGCGSGF